MLSKLLRPSCHISAMLLSVKTPRKINIRQIFNVPPSQYDVPIPKKLQFGYVMKEYWEVIPLFFVTFLACVCFAGGAIIWACGNKVDVVFSTRNRCNISRTMDLRNPSVHKMMIVNQRYEPWPEMADALEKVAAAEKRALMRLQTCNIP